MLVRSLWHLARQKNVTRVLERAVMAEAVAAGRTLKVLESTPNLSPTSSSSSSALVSQASTNSGPTHCGSLDQFFEEIRRQRRLLGHTDSRQHRNDARDQLRQFWTDHVRSAVSMSKSARDLGFVAFYGLADSHLRIPSECLPMFVSLLTRDEQHCAAMDATSILHLIAREMNRCRAEALHPETEVPSELMQSFTLLGFRLLDRLFGSVQRHVGKGEDAIHGLEFLVYVGLTSPQVVPTASKLLHIASQENMRMTSLVSAFALLRVFLKHLGPSDSAEIALELTRRLREKDTRLVNPFHCLKIVNTLTRIDPPGLPQPNLWRYVVSKVAIFAALTTAEHQEVMVASVMRSLLDRHLAELAAELLVEVEELAVPEARRLLREYQAANPAQKEK